MNSGAGDPQITEFLQLQTEVAIRATEQVFAEHPGFEEFVEPQEEVRTLDVLAGGQQRMYIQRVWQDVLMPCGMLLVAANNPGNNHMGIAVTRLGKAEFQVVWLPHVVVQYGYKNLFGRVAALEFIKSSIAGTSQSR